MPSLYIQILRRQIALPADLLGIGLKNRARLRELYDFLIPDKKLRL